MGDSVLVLKYLNIRYTVIFMIVNGKYANQQIIASHLAAVNCSMETRELSPPRVTSEESTRTMLHSTGRGLTISPDSGEFEVHAHCYPWMQ